MVISEPTVAESHYASALNRDELKRTFLILRADDASLLRLVHDLLQSHLLYRLAAIDDP